MKKINIYKLVLALATLFNFPPEIAAGIVLVGASPTGMASNVMTFIACKMVERKKIP